MNRTGKAFTLIEFLVCFSITAIIFAAASAVYFSQQKQTALNNALAKASTLDLAKMSYRQKVGVSSNQYWNSAPDDETRYQFLRAFLFNPPLHLGNGTSSQDYTVVGFTYVLNGLTNATTVIRNSDGVSSQPDGGRPESRNGSAYVQQNSPSEQIVEEPFKDKVSDSSSSSSSGSAHSSAQSGGSVEDQKAAEKVDSLKVIPRANMVNAGGEGNVSQNMSGGGIDFKETKGDMKVVLKSDRRGSFQEAKNEEGGTAVGESLDGEGNSSGVAKTPVQKKDAAVSSNASSAPSPVSSSQTPAGFASSAKSLANPRAVVGFFVLAVIFGGGIVWFVFVRKP